MSTYRSRGILTTPTRLFGLSTANTMIVSVFQANSFGRWSIPITRILSVFWRRPIEECGGGVSVGVGDGVTLGVALGKGASDVSGASVAASAAGAIGWVAGRAAGWQPTSNRAQPKPARSRARLTRRPARGLPDNSAR